MRSRISDTHVILAAVVLAVVAQLTVSAGLIVVGAAVGTAAILLLLWRRRSWSAPSPDRIGPDWEKALLWLAVLVAAFLRLYNVGGIPPGIWLDEGRSGLWALRFLGGETWWGLPEAPEPLAIYVLGMTYKWFGSSLEAGRIASALCGTLTVPVLWWSLRPACGSQVAVAAAACLALSRWHIVVSRLATSYCLLPLCWLIAVGFLARAWKTRRLGYWLAAGAALGLSLYSYLPARALPAVVAGALLVGWRRGAIGHRDLKGVLLLGAGLAVIAAPFVIHLAGSPEATWFRLGQVTRDFRDEPVRAATANLAGLLGVFNFRGDNFQLSCFPRPGDAPLLGVTGGALLVLGLPLLVREGRPLWNGLLLMWAASAAAIAAATGVNMVRLVALSPLVALVQGGALSRLFVLGPVFRWVAAAAVLAIGVEEGGGLLVRRWWTGDPASIESEFQVIKVEMADRVRELSRSHPVYLSPEIGGASFVVEHAYACFSFLAHDWLRRRIPERLDELRRDGGVCVSVIGSVPKKELIEELLPGGVYISFERPRGVSGGLYVMSSRMRGKVELIEFKAIEAAIMRNDEMRSAGRKEEALRILDSAIGRWPMVGELYLRRAELSSATAEPDLAKAIGLSGGKNTRALALLGGIKGDQGKHWEAIQLWTRSLAVNAAQEMVWYNLYRAYVITGNGELAAVALQHGLALFPDSALLRDLSSGL
jgi:hypothetical protein